MKNEILIIIVLSLSSCGLFQAKIPPPRQNPPKKTIPKRLTDTQIIQQLIRKLNLLKKIASIERQKAISRSRIMGKYQELIERIKNTITQIEQIKSYKSQYDQLRIQAQELMMRVEFLAGRQEIRKKLSNQ